MQLTNYEIIEILTVASETCSEKHIRFIAQLLGVEPCKTCDYVKKNCACPGNSSLIGSNID